MSAAAASSPSLRFLGLLKQPDDPNSAADPELELDERDVVWSSSSSVSSANSSPDPSGRLRRPPARPFRPDRIGLSALLAGDAPTPAIPAAARPEKQQQAPPPYHQSAPVAVPAWPKGMGRRNQVEVEEVEEDDDDDAVGGGGGGMVVPPHEMAARRAAAASVLEGAGRTLKGRDLRRVRNAVWRTTGFLDL